MYEMLRRVRLVDPSETGGLTVRSALPLILVLAGIAAVVIGIFAGVWVIVVGVVLFLGGLLATMRKRA
jgi:hypothetical protein